MNARNFAPIASSVPDLRQPAFPPRPPPVLEFARVQPCYEGADDTADYAQATFRPAKPTDPDDVFSQDEDAEDAQALRELLAHSPQPTPQGKWAGIAMDACAQIQELQRLIGELDFFSAGDTGLSRLTQQAEKAKDVLIRAGLRA